MNFILNQISNFTGECITSPELVYRFNQSASAWKSVINTAASMRGSVHVNTAEGRFKTQMVEILSQDLYKLLWEIFLEFPL